MEKEPIFGISFEYYAQILNIRCLKMNKYIFNDLPRSKHYNDKDGNKKGKH